jgi:hypothetical protein
LRRADARPDLHDAKSSLLCASQGILRVVGSHAALFLRRSRLGNAYRRARTFAVRSSRSHPGLGDDQFRHVLDCPFGLAASVCRQGFRRSRQDRPRKCRSSEGCGIRSLEHSRTRVPRFELEPARPGRGSHSGGRTGG